MKIAFVTEIDPLTILGGGEKLLLEIATRLAAKHQVFLLTAGRGRSKQVSDGVRIERLSKRISLLGLRSWIWILRYRPDIVVLSNAYSAAAILTLGSKLRRIKVAMMVHDIWYEKLAEYSGLRRASKIAKFFEKAIVRLPFDCWIAVSNYTKRRLMEVGVDGSKIVVVPPGLDLKLFKVDRKKAKKWLTEKHGIPENAKVVGFVGRIVPGKGIHHILEAASKVEAFFVIVGPIPSRSDPVFIDKSYGREMAVQARNLRNVIFVGAVGDEELPYYYAGFDAFVMPSVSEGFGIAVAEALATGTPAVAFRTSAIPELVKSRYNGLLAEPTSDSLIEAIRLMLNDGAIYDTCRRNARKSVVGYDWPLAIRKFERALESIIGTSGSPGDDSFPYQHYGESDQY